MHPHLISEISPCNKPLVISKPLKRIHMKLKKYILSVLGIGAMATAGLAQGIPGEIKGKVYNDLVEPEPFIEVWVDITGSKKLKAETKEDGSFTLKPLDPGTYVVYATGFGYDTTTIRKVKVRSGEITFLNDIDISAAVDIERTKPLIEKDEPHITKMDQEQIALMPVRYDAKALVTSLTPEIKKSDDGELYFRGSRNGASVYYIDGVKLTGDLANLPSRALGSVKVYTGGIPARYGDTTGGVVAIETPSYFSLWRAEKIRRELERKRANRK